LARRTTEAIVETLTYGMKLKAPRTSIGAVSFHHVVKCPTAA
jgi:hypothetical protein